MPRERAPARPGTLQRPPGSVPGTGPRDGAGHIVGMWDGGDGHTMPTRPVRGLRGRRGENGPAQASLAGATAERAWDHHESRRATGAHCDRPEAARGRNPGTTRRLPGRCAR